MIFSQFHAFHLRYLRHFQKNCQMKTGNKQHVCTALTNIISLFSVNSYNFYQKMCSFLKIDLD
jgi:hypothetical protein